MFVASESEQSIRQNTEGVQKLSVHKIVKVAQLGVPSSQFIMCCMFVDSESEESMCRMYKCRHHSRKPISTYDRD